MNDAACENTDREIWRGVGGPNGSFYADSLYLTNEGALGINCNGSVYVKTLQEWHQLAGAPTPPALDKERLDAAYEAYWAAEGGTFKSIDVAILAYLKG